jgi:hypothetical protein
MILQGQVGAPQASIATGTNPPVRQGQLGDVIVSELHGRFYEQAYRGTLFSGGISAVTSISAATFTSATTGATATPLLGIHNPVGSAVNCVVLQATLAVTLTALQATGAGPYVWMTGQNTALTIAGTSSGFNRKTFTTTGGQGQYFTGAAITNFTGTLVTRFGSAIGGGASYNASLLGTAVGFMTPLQAFTENLDGSIIVPPGFVLVLMATTTPVAHSAVSNILWEEVAL